MKLSLLHVAVIPALLFFTSCKTENTLNDLNRYGYSGPVEQVTVYKYLNYTGAIDSPNFNFRTLYDYNKDGNVHFMQFVINRSMYNMPSVAINYTYSFDGGKKTGWKEHNLFTQDSLSKGTIAWGENGIVEKCYDSTGNLMYEIRTELNSDRYEEKLRILQYNGDSAYYDQQTVNVLEDGEVIYRLQHDLHTNTIDTIFVENVEKDQHGNVTRLIEWNKKTGEKQYLLRVFRYREEKKEEKK